MLKVIAGSDLGFSSGVNITTKYELSPPQGLGFQVIRGKGSNLMISLDCSISEDQDGIASFLQSAIEAIFKAQDEIIQLAIWMCKDTSLSQCLELLRVALPEETRTIRLLVGRDVIPYSFKLSSFQDS